MHIWPSRRGARAWVDPPPSHWRRGGIKIRWVWSRATFVGRPEDYFFFLGGTFLPFLRASDSPMAIACLRLFTVPPLPPLPLLSVPFLRRSIALLTLFE